jgi:hypothetical protein
MEGLLHPPARTQELAVFRWRTGGQMSRIHAQRFSRSLPDPHAGLEWPVGKDVRDTYRGPI